MSSVLFGYLRWNEGPISVGHKWFIWIFVPFWVCRDYLSTQGETTVDIDKDMNKVVCLSIFYVNLHLNFLLETIRVLSLICQSFNFFNVLLLCFVFSTPYHPVVDFYPKCYCQIFFPLCCKRLKCRSKIKTLWHLG